MGCLIFSTVVPNVFAATITANSCSLTHVQAAVTSAQRGDTVTVPPGSCNWEAGVTITKAITLQGAGAALTIITAIVNASSTVHLVSYSATNADKDTLFRVTGFTFDINNKTKTGFIVVEGTGTRGSFTPMRVDNNRILNTVSGLTGSFGDTMALAGLVKGVIDNNYIQGAGYLTMVRFGRAWLAPTQQNPSWPSVTSWDNGTDDNIFFEDNIIVRPSSGWSNVLMGSQAGSFVARYNTFDYSACSGGYHYMVDTHGLQVSPEGYRSIGAFGAELYGNRFIGTGGQLGELRGGIHKVFYNKYIAALRPNITLWETYGPYIASIEAFTCPSGSRYAGTPSCTIDGRSTNVEKTYLWNNLWASSDSAAGSPLWHTVSCGGGAYPAPSVSGALPLREDIEYWLPKTSFNGTTGTGCGTLGNRPATCTTGVGYWATNQSCSEVPVGSFGPNPTTPIAGTLFRCGPTDTWTTYYTPYAYPHPLRSGEVETISAPKGFKLVN
jgi:hypothetical protein